MKGKLVLLMGIVVLCLGLVGSPASWAASITFQGVTFSVTDLGGTLRLGINNVSGATGDWTGIDTLEAFSLKDTGLTGLSLTGWTGNGLELNSSGCTGGGSGGFCFDHALMGLSDGFTLANNNTFDLTYTGGTLADAPHLKVRFSGADVPNGHGSLLSQAVPVPGTLLMFGLGMVALVGWSYHTKRARRGLVV